MSLRNRAALSLALTAVLSSVVASADDGGSDKSPELTFDETYDFELHEAHAKAVEAQVKSAEAFAPGLLQRAASDKFDLKPFVDDAKYLADLEQPASPELAEKLKNKHQATLQGVEGKLGLPGFFGTMQGGGAMPPITHVPSGGSLDAGFCGECQNLVFDAPFPGYFAKTFPLGWAVVSPDPVWGLTVDFRSGVIGAGHTVGVSGERFPVPAGGRFIRASGTMNLFTDIGVGGLGVAHGWSDVQLVVREVGSGAEMCRSPRFEPANLATLAWYAREARDHGERTLGCRFERDPSSPATYDALIELRAYGTYAGLSGGHSVIRADFKRIDVEICP